MSVIRLAFITLVAGMLTSCTFPGRRPSQPSGPPQLPPAREAAAQGQGYGSATSIDALAAQVKANARRSDHEIDSEARAQLAAQSASAADACLKLDSRSAACQYSRAVATGMEARAHPTRAVALLDSMLESLNQAEASDPGYDHAGPLRVKALVLLRAPGWPLGPGDTDAGLTAARGAVSLQPQYPPNVLVLAEALAKAGDAAGAHENYARARDLALALPAGPDRDEWAHEATQGLGQQ